jgi:predicted transcriptional regulator
MTAIRPSQQADRIVVRLPDGLREDLKRIAKARHRSVSNLAFVVLEDFVNDEKAASNHTA